MNLYHNHLPVRIRGHVVVLFVEVDKSTAAIFAAATVVLVLFCVRTAFALATCPVLLVVAVRHVGKRQPRVVVVVHTGLIDALNHAVHRRRFVGRFRVFAAVFDVFVVLVDQRGDHHAAGDIPGFLVPGIVEFRVPLHLRNHHHSTVVVTGPGQSFEEE